MTGMLTAIQVAPTGTGVVFIPSAPAQLTFKDSLRAKRCLFGPADSSASNQLCQVENERNKQAFFARYQIIGAMEPPTLRGVWGAGNDNHGNATNALSDVQMRPTAREPSVEAVVDNVTNTELTPEATNAMVASSDNGNTLEAPVTNPTPTTHENSLNNGQRGPSAGDSSSGKSRKRHNPGSMGCYSIRKRLKPSSEKSATDITNSTEEQEESVHN